MNGKDGLISQLLVGLLVIWIIVTAAVIALVDISDTALLGWSILGAIVLTCVARPFKFSGILMTGLGVLAYLALGLYRLMRLSLSGIDMAGVLPLVGAAICLILAGVLAEAVILRLVRVAAQLDRDSTIIQELTLRDEHTGTLKNVYADRLMSGEIERSRRYNRTLTLVLLAHDDWSTVVREKGRDESARALKTAGELLTQGLRSVDTASRYHEASFLAILPETTISGAQVVADRLARSINSKTGLRFRAGLAEFPGDAVSKKELINEAEAALKFARSADLTVASRGLLV